MPALNGSLGSLEVPVQIEPPPCFPASGSVRPPGWTSGFSPAGPSCLFPSGPGSFMERRPFDGPGRRRAFAGRRRVSSLRRPAKDPSRLAAGLLDGSSFPSFACMVGEPTARAGFRSCSPLRIGMDALAPGKPDGSRLGSPPESPLLRDLGGRHSRPHGSALFPRRSPGRSCGGPILHALLSAEPKALKR